MRKLAKLAFAGIAAAAIAGTAVAASADRHVMTVDLPDGGTAHIEYYGDVAPKVTFAPGAVAPFRVGWAPLAFPDLGNFDQVFARMAKQREALLKQAQEMARGVGGSVAPANVASFGNMPAGANSVSVVSISNDSGTCTRTTQVTSQGAGKAPKVVSNISGDCAPDPGSKLTTARGPLDRT
jgi:hypothetical protein